MSNKVFEGVTEVVREIYARDGEVKASVLVDEARPEESPAHPAFEWRDDVAAEEYRLIQGRQLIKRVTVIENEREVQLVHVASVDHSNSREGKYKSVDVVVETPNEFELAFSEAVQRLRSARKAVEVLESAARKMESTDDRAAIIAQISESLSLLQTALDRAVH